MEVHKGVNHFIVKVSGRYQNSYGDKGVDGKEIVRSHIYDDYENTTKSGVVVAAPNGVNVPIGSILHFDFKVCKKAHWGEDYCIDKKQNLFRVPYKPSGVDNMAFAYQVGDDVYVIGDDVFLRPVKQEVEKTKSGLIIAENIEDKVHFSGEVKDKEMHGEVVYLGDYFKDWGIAKGDTLVFKKGAEYEFEIKGEKLFKVPESFLLAKAV